MKKRKWHLYNESKKPEDGIRTCGNGDESDDNELVECQSEATTNTFQEIRGI